MSESQVISQVNDDLLRGTLLVVCGMVGIKDVDDATLVMICKNLKRYYGNFAINELLLAFELNANGKLEDRYEPYGNFDNNYVSKVLDAYRFLRIEARKELEAKQPKLPEAEPPTDEELYKGLLAMNEIPEYYNWTSVFKHMEKIGKINMSLEEKKNHYQEVYKSLGETLTLTDRANMQESEYQEMVKRECRKQAVIKCLRA
jgi:hypothetical protein